MSDLDVCTLCSLKRRDHTLAEADGTVHHRFSGVGGSLEPLKEPKKPKVEVREVSGPPADVVLRTILLEKGIIALEDVEKAEMMLRTTGVLRNSGNSSQ